jgi:hypothetical protein
MTFSSATQTWDQVALGCFFNGISMVHHAVIVHTKCQRSRKDFVGSDTVSLMYFLTTSPVESGILKVDNRPEL